MPTHRFDAFAVTAPGLSPLCAAELRAMGMRPTSEDPAGVGFSADAAHLIRANLWLRTASRVIVRLAQFKATTFKDLQLTAATIKWAQVIQPGQPVALRVTCKKSKLIHSGAVAQRVGEAITKATQSPIVRATGVEDADDDDAAPAVQPQLIVVRFDRDICTISADSSGELLHRRGYRQQLAKAPMRETLAAGLLLSAGYTGAEPLIDPMCGSGTIAIEAALIARNIAPGLNRKFICTTWAQVGATADAAERQRARGMMRAATAPIIGTDRDAGAITASLANAERAGVSGDVTFSARALSALEAPPTRTGASTADGTGESAAAATTTTTGLLATNPPYGARVGATRDLRDLYARLGDVARTLLPGWRVAMVSADRQLEHATGLDFDEQVRTSNGGIPVRFIVAPVPAA
jgi:putative N6-adenine-specific DNA methylase